MKKNAWILLLLLSVVLTGCFDSASSVPDEWKEHVYMLGKETGYCETLAGDTEVQFFFVSDSVSVWTDGEIDSATEELRDALDSLEDEASDFGVSLSLSFRTFAVTVDADTDSDGDWCAKVLTEAGLPDTVSVQLLVESQRDVDQAPFVFLLNRAGRSYAYSASMASDFEYCVLYGTELSAFRHELFHLFGAEDFYFPAEVSTLASSFLPGSVMNDGDAADDLTAFLIGWRDGLTEDAEAFLAETAYLTPDFLEEEREKDQITGYGTVPMGEGSYTGDLVMGIPHGNGRLTFPDGSYYEGEWNNGYCEGHGVYVFAEGERYEGEFRNDYFEGYGVFTWTDGTVYEGNWSEDCREGYGRMIYPDGTVEEGIWKDDELIG